MAWSPRHGRFAVADGASASAFACLWAQLLARAYAGGTLHSDTLEDDLEPLQTNWAATVEGRDLPWYAHEQVRRGAFAALVGVTVNNDYTWSALAVGDCCLFHLRGYQIRRAFPLHCAEQFNNRPLLLGSRATANVSLRNESAIHWMHGTWDPGDVFLLMSDALAAAFMQRPCLDFKPTRRGFDQWIDTQRTQKRLRNDDVSLLQVIPTCNATA